MKNIQDIIPGRKITKTEPKEFANIKYESWNVEGPIFSDQIETLLENGYMVSVLSDNKIYVNKLISPSPDQIRDNKRFWRCLDLALEDKK